MIAPIFIVLLAALLAKAAKAPACETGWVPYKDELCIKAFTDEVHTYQEAVQHCSSFSDEFSQASLVMVKDPDLQKVLADYTNTAAIFDYIWLGGKYENASSQFKWEDGEALIYTNWQTGYPKPVTDADACIELRPTEAKDDSNVAAKWAHTTCRKRNLVMCQKTLSWSLKDTIAEIVKVRKEIEELQEISRRVVPLGSIYIEYPNQPSPTTLWPSLTWRDITSTYAGLFFRAEGGGSDSWGATQAACAPRISHVQYGQRTGGEYARTLVVADSGWSDFVSVGEYDWSSGMDHYHKFAAIQFHTQTCEVRPKNQAIRVWKREA